MYSKKQLFEHKTNIISKHSNNNNDVDSSSIPELLIFEEEPKVIEAVKEKDKRVSLRLNSIGNWLKYYWYLIIDLVSLTGTIAAIITFIHQGIGTIDIGILGFMFVLTGLGGEAGMHRLFAHKSYQVAKPIRILLAIAGSMLGEAPIIEYAAYHRCHHAFADHPGDPHSPHYCEGKGFFTWLKNVWHTFMGWKYNPKTNNLAQPEKYAKDLLAEPEIVFINQSFHWLVLASFLLPALLGFVLTRTYEGAWTALLWGGLFRLFVMTIIDDCVLRAGCHLFGTRPFTDQSKSMSTNISILALPTFGASLHNNHHAFPCSAVAGISWWQLDLSGLLITFLEKIGLAWKVGRPTAKQIEARAALK